MAITRVQYVATASASGATSLTATLAATTAGNLLVAHVAVGSTASNGTCSTPTGWTLAVGPATTESGAVSDVNEYIFYKIAGAGETSATFTDSVSSGITIQVWEFSTGNGWGANPLDVTSSSSNQGPTTSPVTGTTSTTAQNEELWIAGLTTHYATGEVYSSPLNGFTLETTATAGSGAFFAPSSAALYLIASATGNAASGATANTSKPFAGVIATFKVAGNINITVADTLAATDAVASLTASMTIAERITATEGISVPATVNIFVNDSFTASDAVQVGAAAVRFPYKSQIVLCYTAAGVFVDVVRDAPLLSGVKFAINSAANPLRIQLPRSFDSFDEAGTTGARGTIAQGNVWQYWLFGPGLPDAGLLKFQGVIDSYQPQINEQGEESLTVTLTPYDAVVGDSGIVGSVTFGTLGVSASYVDPVAMFAWWFNNNNGVTGHPYTWPLTQDPTNPTSSAAVKTAYMFQNQNLGSSFETIRKMLPANWFWRPNQDKTVTLNVPPVTAQHTFTIGQHLTAPQYRKDWTKLRNAIQVQGNVAPILRLTVALASSTAYTSITVEPLPFALISGQNVELNPTGNSAILLTLSANAAAGATTISVNSFNTGSNSYPVNTQVGIVIQATATGSDVSTLGYRLLQVADSRVMDVNTAQALANGLLSQYDVQVLRTAIRVVDYRGDAQVGIGYDIETILPGDSVTIVNPALSSNATLWDAAVWDSSSWDYSPGAALSQVATIYAVNYHWDYVDLEIGAPPPSQDRTLLELARQFQDYTLVP